MDKKELEELIYECEHALALTKASYENSIKARQKIVDVLVVLKAKKIELLTQEKNE